MAYTIGDAIIVRIEFRTKATDALVDPTAWQVEVQPPGGQAKVVLVFTVASELTQITVPGVFQYRQLTGRDTAADAGTWVYWVTSTGTGQSSRRSSFVVDPSPFA